MANTSGGNSTKQLKQVLGFKELLSTAIGQIIGAGIMTLLGAGIALTGRSIPLAFLISFFLVIGTYIPLAIVTGTVRVRGGQYTMVGMLAGKEMAGFFVIMHILINVSLAMYGISFAQYFMAFFGIGNTKVIAVIVLTVFYLINLVGVDVMAKFQNVIVILMCIALGLFAAFGVGQVTPNYLMEDFMPNGVFGLFQAAGLLYFAMGGCYVITNLSAEAKRPTRDIPLAMIVSTLIVALLYAVVSIVAAGVLPVDVVAGQTLDAVARTILPAPVYAFFMVAGAMFALISTLNAQYAWAPKPVMQACDDGWFSQKLAYLHPKFNTPVVLITILYVFGVVCVISGLDVSILSNLATIAGCLADLLISMFLWRLPKVVGPTWEKSKFKLSPVALRACCVICSIACVITLYLNATQLTLPLLVANIIVIIVALIWAYFRGKSGKVHMEMSYEEV